MENDKNTPDFIFCRPFNEDHYEYSFNMEKFHLMEKYEFKFFLKQRISIPYTKVLYAIDHFQTFLIDNQNSSIEELTSNEEDRKLEIKKRVKEANYYKEKKEEDTSWLRKVSKKVEKTASIFEKLKN